MNQRANYAAVLFGACLGAAVVVLSYWGVTRLPQWFAVPSQTTAQTQETSQAIFLDTERAESESGGTGPAQDAAQDAQRLELFKSLLDESNAQLAGKTKELKDKTVRVTHLQEQYDEAVRLVMDLIDRTQEQELAGDSTMDDLQGQLVEAQDRQELLSMQLSDVKAELGDAYLEMASLREAADQGMIELLQSEALLRSATSEILKAIGQASVEPLINALQNDNAVVRRWACQMIAAIGPEAREAADALQAATNDAAPTVREAARQAMMAISE